MNNRLAALVICMPFIISACSNDDPATAPPSLAVFARGDAALIVVVENSDGERGSALEAAFELRREQTLQVLAGILGIDTAAMRGMMLNEILENYGEPWMIRELAGVAGGKYVAVRSFSDESARASVFLDTLRALSRRGFIVDVIFDLHSDGGTVLFSDGRCSVSSLAQAVRDEGLRMRSLYQTCCYGGAAIATWKNAGVTAVSGAAGVNSITLYSPIAFLKNWTGGETFRAAVDHAFQQELDTLRSYAPVFPEILWLMTDDNLTASRQICGGAKPDIFWNESLFRKSRPLASAFAAFAP